MIDYLKAQVAHMAKDNGYNDGVEAGKAEWNRQNYEWIKSLEWSDFSPDVGSVCPICKRSEHCQGDHLEHCYIGNYLRDNKPR